MSSISENIKKLAIEIPQVAKPAAAYVPYLVQDDVLYVSGQLPLENGELKHKGLVGNDSDIDQVAKAAEICALNIAACVKDATNGDFDKLERILHLQVLVASKPDFNNQHLVANGASNFLVKLFGDQKGSHTRAAYGVASLPLGANVEIAATVKLKQ
jgi:enamine deaminase RidA (YjgF/YER057c/UK114 family)